MNIVLFYTKLFCFRIFYINKKKETPYNTIVFSTSTQKDVYKYDESMDRVLFAAVCILNKYNMENMSCVCLDVHCVLVYFYFKKIVFIDKSFIFIILF